jgi:hypothetical protein
MNNEHPQPLPLTTIINAFDCLKYDTHVALHTQLGDAACIEEQIRICAKLQTYITQVDSHFFQLN